MSVKQWENLQCPDCPSTRFVQVVTIKFHEGSGATNEPAGLRCADCHTELDLARMIDQHQYLAKKRELDAMRAELESAAPKAKEPKTKEAVGVGSKT